MRMGGGTSQTRVATALQAVGATWVAQSRSQKHKAEHAQSSTRRGGRACVGRVDEGQRVAFPAPTRPCALRVHLDPGTVFAHHAATRNQARTRLAAHHPPLAASLDLPLPLALLPLALAPAPAPRRHVCHPVPVWRLARHQGPPDLPRLLQHPAPPLVRPLVVHHPLRRPDPPLRQRRHEPVQVHLPRHR